jgi:alkanesulfonate monooxygenase SsuD/methylene tetrahydromethanopterin reductase-like flavin-dependent oxidoreductase (luciferase family)
MQFVYFHLMPWPHLTDDFDANERSAWVTYSNANYDPQKGHDLYHEYLSQLLYAEELGYDAISVNEHHQTAYGLMPSPNVMASWLIANTSKAKIAILGNALPLRDHPMRIAEEIAMMDVISGGRIICGFVRGIGPEYHNFTMNPAIGLERFREAHDLIIKAWTEPGPFRWEGHHYPTEHVNPWPRPMQQPHPPIWIPSQGSGETIEWAAERHYTFVVTFTPHRNVARYMEQYREQARGFGYEATPDQMAWAVPIYVGETDESAMAEAGPHAEYMFNRLLKRPLSVFFPPGYLSEASAKGVLRAFGALGTMQTNVQQMNEDGQMVIGSAKNVLQRLKDYVDQSGIGNLVVLNQFGSMPNKMARANMERFARDVMPELREHVSAVYKKG